MMKYSGKGFFFGLLLTHFSSSLTHIHTILVGYDFIETLAAGSSKHMNYGQFFISVGVAMGLEF